MSSRDKLREAREDSWFSSGFQAEKMKLTSKQFFFLHNRWDAAKSLFPKHVISFLELSSMRRTFWLASLSRKQASFLISKMKGDDGSRCVSKDLEESLQDFQCSRMTAINGLTEGCSDCGEAWSESPVLQEVSGDVFLVCSACGSVFSLGLGGS